MKRAIILVVILLTITGLMAQTTFTEQQKTDLQTVMTLVEGQPIDFSTVEWLHVDKVYFKNCTITGVNVRPFVRNCAFEACTFDVSLFRAKFIRCAIVDSWIVTAFTLERCILHGSNIPNEYRASCKPEEMETFTAAAYMTTITGN